MPVSEEDLLNRLLRAHAEELRTTANLTRHLGLAARARDQGGFAAAKAAFEASAKRCEALRLSLWICQEMRETQLSVNRAGLSIVPLPAPPTVTEPQAKRDQNSVQIHPAA
ncbi:MAG TPA: hypothetical protein VFT60_06435 [Bryobacteraceae bacterium]|nr:hypothetical protein [Bryobacteraceae bacterium]